MFWWIVAPFVQTAPHAAPEAAVDVKFQRREEMTADGLWCTWEAESLTYGDQVIWGEAMPTDEPWCARPPFESSRRVDVLGRDGPFVSVRLTEWNCCPDKEVVTRCVTYDVRTGQPATIEAYDPRWAKWRDRRLSMLTEKRDGGGWTYEPSAFIVGHGHLEICAVRGDETARIPVR
jgi:hypothetical protein